MNQTQRVPYSREWETTEREIQREPVIITRHITKGEKALWTLAVCVIFVLALALVAGQARLFSASGEIASLQNKLSGQQKITQQFKTESDSLSSPERIVRFAETQLGLKLNVNNIKVLP